ncbi:hypothetical protein DFH07DRAFT_869441 [Mycena maculata]|uniref:N-acetyltransferase domain-containing protein n=1 Tax=Mycena maculata TaxID=230809 RepID=A0AAD7IPL0_9AGAR|nr:hypothetical protein DFH07DRAFT_869441 [Mycena maculata]
MNIRLAKLEDLLRIQATNLPNLPENILDEVLLNLRIYHAMRWPQISFVAEDHKGRRDAEKTGVHCHVNSISVLRSYRCLGFARKLMVLSQEAMGMIYKVSYAAIALYRDSLGFRVAKVEQKYYGAGEDALSMQLDLHR